MRYVMELRVSELAPARSHADVAHVRGCVQPLLGLGYCSVAHTDTQSTESERQRATVAVRTQRVACTLSDTCNGATHKLLCARFGIDTALGSG